MRDSFDFVLVLSRQLIVLEIDLPGRSEEHTSELQSRLHLVCRLLLEKKKRQAHGDVRVNVFDSLTLADGRSEALYANSSALLAQLHLIALMVHDADGRQAYDSDAYRT